MHTRMCDLFGIEFPIFAFSHCRDVVAAVSRAGGLGVLGALAFSPEQLEIELKWIDEHVDGKPYGLDVVMPASYAGADIAEGSHEQMESALQQMIPEEPRAFINAVLARDNVPSLPPGESAFAGVVGGTYGGRRIEVEVVLGRPIKLLVNALGDRPRDMVQRA